LAFWVYVAGAEAPRRFTAVEAAEAHAGEGVAAARAHVEAMLGLQVWSHHLYAAVRGAGH
jgi:hypothetical protein